MYASNAVILIVEDSRGQSCKSGFKKMPHSAIVMTDHEHRMALTAFSIHGSSVNDSCREKTLKTNEDRVKGDDNRKSELFTVV